MFFPNALPPPLMHADDNVSKSHFFATSSPRARPSTKTPPMHGFGTLCSASLSCEFRPRFFFPLPFHLGMNHLPGAVDRSPVRWNKANTSVCVCVCDVWESSTPGYEEKKIPEQKTRKQQNKNLHEHSPSFSQDFCKVHLVAPIHPAVSLGHQHDVTPRSRRSTALGKSSGPASADQRLVGTASAPGEGGARALGRKRL